MARLACYEKQGVKGTRVTTLYMKVIINWANIYMHHHVVFRRVCQALLCMYLTMVIVLCNIMYVLQFISLGT